LGSVNCYLNRFEAQASSYKRQAASLAPAAIWTI